MSNSSKSSDPSLDDLYKQMDTLKADISKLTTTVADVGKAEAKRAVDIAKSKGEEVKDAGEEHMRELRARAEGYGQDAGVFMREQPGTALGVAAGFGFLIGFLMSTRR